jgi:hypothetical protein
MKIFSFRLLFILIILFFEFSFFDVLFPWVSAPIIIIASVVAWSLLRPFPLMFFMTIPLTLLFDIVSSGRPNIFSLYAVLLVYTTSFISRRLLVEQRGFGLWLYALFSALSVFCFTLFEYIFSKENVFTSVTDTFLRFFPIMLSLDILLSMLFSLPLFILAYFSISRFEKYIHYVAQGEILKLK